MQPQPPPSTQCIDTSSESAFLILFLFVLHDHHELRACSPRFD
jgi:hypothetical protein